MDNNHVIVGNSLLLLGDSLQRLKELPENSIDAVVTDPPYGLSFMNKKWDYDVPTTELWREVYRVLKPGGHLLSFFGTRTYHRGVVRIEDAGFEIRDQIQWLYGSGFPKSLDVSKAIDKAAGVEREVVGVNPNHRTSEALYEFGSHGGKGDGLLTSAKTENAKRWQGWGTALKPANEPIVLARKPLEKGLTVAENVLKWGTGAINVDGSRIGTEKMGGQVIKQSYGSDTHFGGGEKRNKQVIANEAVGRWPANVILDEAAAVMLDAQSGDKCGVSRFFYVAKASKRERNAGLEGMPHQNHHPTVKPIKLMEYLIKLVTPPNGVVLDPFMGSGSTGVAAKHLGFNFIGCELSPEYFEICHKRIANTKRTQTKTEDETEEST